MPPNPQLLNICLLPAWKLDILESRWVGPLQRATTQERVLVGLALPAELELLVMPVQRPKQETGMTTSACVAA